MMEKGIENEFMIELIERMEDLGKKMVMGGRNGVI